MGVEVVRPDGGAFDASRHRAVETRRGPAERVLEVVRAGYVVGRRVVREAEVVVGRP
jgi:molecular chaperone GrpE (heat shock protein)